MEENELEVLCEFLKDVAQQLVNPSIEDFCKEIGEIGCKDIDEVIDKDKAEELKSFREWRVENYGY